MNNGTTTEGVAGDASGAVEAKPGPGDGSGVGAGAIASGVEACVFASERAVAPGKIAEALGLEGVPRVGKLVEEAIGLLNASYEREGRAFRVRKVAGGWRVMTEPEHAEAVARLRGMHASQRLSRAALETLAVVAYRQPITRAHVEAIRGVACGEVLRTLLEKKLVQITGRAEEVGRPLLYGTTKRFLEVFGLSTLKDLPDTGVLKEPASPQASPPPADAGDEDSPAGSNERGPDEAGSGEGGAESEPSGGGA